ncbi:LysR family transcriptional regulator [Derxia gummosa]|uniref:LysR family transcriptional regulator n=1 Tax=Derxia gummosa DSM 723 TaxID=1121388 RepID=A0A8B6X7S2_9BURK|nr:LysR family transcriptional regulator [Derxia gummosa]
MDWDNLRYFLELSRSGRLAVAARRLGVDHTTVSRRVQALETAVGQPLFVREAGGHVLTEAGRRLLPQAEVMESACLAIEPQPGAAALDDRLSGLVRIGATEGFGTRVLAPALAAFGQRHPHVAVDLLAVPRLVSLSRREADIVVTLERPARGPYVLTRLTDYALRAYASPGYLAAHAPIKGVDDLRRHAFVGYVDDLLFSRELHFLDDLCRPERFALRSTSVLAQHEAAANGAGVAILPAFLADGDARLVPVLPAQTRVIRTFWMTMPEEIRHLARMRAVWEFLKGTVEGQRGRLLAEG